MTRSWSARMADSTMVRFPILAEEWNYQWGLVLKGIEEVWRATGDPIYLDYIQRNVDHFVQPDGTIRGYRLEEYNVDRLNPGKAIFPLYEKTGDSKYERALDCLRSQLDTHPRTISGGFWHKKIYPNQMWLDGIYMADAFYAQYEGSMLPSKSRSDRARSAFEDIAHQIILIEEHTRDPKTGLLYHAWDESHAQRWANPQTGCSPHFWGRALGWYAMALADVLDFFPRAHPRRDQIIAILARTLDAVRQAQDPDTHVWFQILDQGPRPGNYRESSASCMFVYAMAKGARHKYLSPEYAAVARAAFAGILSQFVTPNSDDTINLTGTCQSAGLGGTPYRDGSFEYYAGEPVVTNNHHGVGAFILASAEVEKL